MATNGRAKQLAQVSLGERISLLRGKRRELMRPVLENPRKFVLLSSRGLARELKTDSATMVRIVRAMQFENYHEFQQYLHEVSIATATSLDFMQARTPSATSNSEKITASLDQDFRNLTELRNSVNAKQVDALARRIHASRRVLILGGDMAASLVAYLEHGMTLLGLPAISATTSGRIVSVVRTVDRRDVVIAISFGRGLRQTVEGLRQARARGAHTVGMTDTFLSPIARFSNECLHVPAATVSFVDSYVAPMALINALLVACTNYKRHHTLALLKQASDEQRSGFRWFSDGT